MLQINNFSLKTKYLLISSFYELEVRHGGVKRADQVVELFKEFDIVMTNPYFSIKKAIKFAFYSPIEVVESFIFSIYLFFRGLSCKGLILFSFKLVEVIKVIKAYKEREIILEGGGNLPILVMNYLIFKNLKYNTFLQNIEYLVPEKNLKNYFKSPKDKYFLELNGYKNANSIYTIGYLDSAILGCHKVQSETINYYPSGKDYKKLERIRTYRNKKNIKNNSGFILLLGSVSNPPTKQGMLDAIKFFQSQKNKYQVKVAGFGTNMFNHLKSSNIDILGSVTEEKLKKLMQNAKCLIVNQVQTTGFLIKIVDFNLAGIPIFLTSDYYQGLNLEKYGIFRVDYSKIYKILNSKIIDSKFSTFDKPKLKYQKN